MKLIPKYIKLNCGIEVHSVYDLVVEIDDGIKHPPTFIKMDVQTFEIQALLEE